MACECDANSVKRYEQSTLGDNPPLPALVERAAARIKSFCHKVEVPSPNPPPPSPPGPEREMSNSGDYLVLDVARLAILGEQFGYRLTWSPIPEGLSGPQSLCVITYDVRLLPGSTPGLTISEVQFGDDRIAADIGVGHTNSFSISCEESCGKSRKASVTITDANGLFRARLSGFEICLCGVFA
jgi:hypothetical protein